MSNDIIVVKNDNQKLVEKRQKRNSDSAVRVISKDSQDLLGLAVQRWSEYAGPDGVGPTRPSGYYETFSSMIRRALEIPQKKKGVELDDLSPVTLLAVTSIKTVLAMEMQNWMDRNLTREEIKSLYKKLIKRAAEPNLEAMRAERTLMSPKEV